MVLAGCEDGTGLCIETQYLLTFQICDGPAVIPPGTGDDVYLTGERAGFEGFDLFRLYANAELLAIWYIGLW